MVRVRHSLFSDCYGWAIKPTTVRNLLGSKHPGAIVKWDNPKTLLNSRVAFYNLVFIVPAVTRKVEAS